MNSIRQLQNEANAIALRRYDLTMQRESIEEQLEKLDQRMREVQAALRMAEQCETDKAQALEAQRDVHATDKVRAILATAEQCDLEHAAALHKRHQATAQEPPAATETPQQELTDN